MQIKHIIIDSLALLLLCSCTVCIAASGQSQSEALEVVLDILRGDDPQMQTAAISMAREMPGTEVTKALADELPNLPPTCQVQLLSALGDRGDASALPAVIAAAKVQEQSVRVSALKAIGQLGAASQVGLLADAAANTSGEEQKAARNSLYSLRDAGADQKILSSIQNAEPPIKVELIFSVGERNIDAGIGTLLITAKDSDRKVRTASFRVLRLLAGPKDLPELLRLLLNLQSPTDRIEAERTVAAVARKIEQENLRAQDVLAVLPSAKETENRCSLLNVLGQIGDGSALPVLRAGLDDRQVDIQTAAVRALSNWPNAEPLDDLLRIARDRSNKVQKTLALRGFVRALGLADNLPAKDKVKMYEQAMSLAPNTMEKRNVLSGLADAGSFEAMNLVSGFLDEPELKMEAEAAVLKIAGVIYGNYPRQTANILKKISQTAKNESLRREAQELLKQIEQLEQKD